jgi:hypothetical protein
MRPAWIMLIFIPVLLPLTAGAQQPHPYADTLHKQAVSWLKQKTTSPNRMAPELGKAINEKLQQGRDFSMILGPNLTKSGKSVYMTVWGDKLFTFELSSSQQKQTGVRPGGTILIEGIPEREVGRTPDVVKLAEVSFEGGTRLKASRALEGLLKFTPKGKFEDEVVIRVSCLVAGQRVTQFHHVRGGLPANDRIQFRLKPLNEVSGKPLTGPAVLFVDFCSTTEASGAVDLTVRSNAVAVLVDLE